MWDKHYPEANIIVFQSDLTKEKSLFAYSARDLIPLDSDVWLYIDLFEEIDVDDFEVAYNLQGNEAKDPRMMLRTIFYGLTHGVISGRKLEAACRYDNRFRVLCGDRCPVQKTFCNFLNRHEEAMADLFVQVVRLAQRMGLASLGQVSLDGSRFKANTSKHKAMSKKFMDRNVEKITSELEELRNSLRARNSEEDSNDIRLEDEIKLKEQRLEKIASAKKALEEEKGESIKNKDQKSFNDHDAKPMARKGKDFQYGYNCQAAVDGDHQIIVGAEIAEGSSDAGNVAPMIEAVKEAAQAKPEKLLADAGYAGEEDIVQAENAGVEAYVSKTRGERLAEQTAQEQIVVDDETGAARCIAGKELPIKNRHKDGSRTYQIDGNFCKGCRYVDFCALRKRSNRKVKLSAKERQDIVNRVRARMRTDEAQKIYKKRKAVVEPVFGNIKNKGIVIRVKGKKKVAAWWKRAATAHNVEKIINFISGSLATASV